MSLSSIRRKKLSSALTILGIVIGISAIIGLVSLGQSLESTVSDQLEQFGPDNIIVMAAMTGGMPGSAMMGETLKEDDIETIEDINGVDMAVGMLIKTLSVSYGDEATSTYIAGIPAEKAQELFSDMNVFEIDRGRFFEDGEERVAVLGSKIANDMFEDSIRTGERITIRGKTFKVVGIMKSTGSSQDDQAVVLPIETLWELTDSEDEYTMIYAKASDYTKAGSIAEKIEKKLDDKYGENAYMAMTSEQLMESISGIFAVLSLVLGGIASIALVVAGVGIANTMLMSVLERTREIGIMKAIGATNTKIMEIFLIESALIGLIGGVIGSIAGVILSYGVSFVASSAFGISVKATVPFWLVGGALLFSIVVGILSGVWPALRAAKLNPVEALRYQ